MNWIRIILDTRAEHTEALGQHLMDAGAVAVTLKDAGTEALYEPAPGQAPLWAEVRLEGLFEPGTCISAVMDRLQGRAGDHRIINAHCSPLADRAWECAHLEDFHSMRFGSKTWIHSSRDTRPIHPDAVVIDLEPGLAFGTGSHPTTALCLEWLDREPPANQCVVDYGCGSGVLAIAAVKHGASRAWAVDYDPQALAATRANARKNRVARRIEACSPEQLAGMPRPAVDTLLANILAGPLATLAPRFADLVRPGGALVLSGLLAHQARRITEVYEPWFQMDTPVGREGWVAISGRRRE